MSHEFPSPSYLSIVRKGEQPQVEATPPAWEEERDYEAYSAVPDTHHVESLWLRRQKEAADDVFLDYAWRRHMQYDRRGGLITILFADCSVRIVGRGLHPVMMKLCQKKVEWIEEHDPARWPEPDGALPFVSEIEVEFFNPAFSMMETSS